MEILSSSPHDNTDVQEGRNTPASCTSKKRCHIFPFFVIAVLFGFIGGVVSPVITTFYREHRNIPLLSLATKSVVSQPTSSSLNIGNDLIPSLVERNSAGVVSIVVSKDISKLRNFRESPLQGFPFFTPFNIPQKNDQNSSDATGKQKIGSGSGFFVSADGLIITNKHVVTDEQADYTVIANGGKEYSATVLARDPNNDIAHLKIEGSDFPALTLGDSDILKVGQTVVAIGNSLGEFSDSVTSGIISGLKRNVFAGSQLGVREELTDIIQTDAAINPGNSGGPLFDISGDVIGINVAMAQGAENIGFALPINGVKRIIEQVRTTGKISVPYIGVRYVILNDVIQKENNLPYNYGALILRGQTMTDFAVIPGSPADKAGLTETDVILEINGTKIDETHLLGTVINQYNVGDELTLKIWHKGDMKDVKVTLKERK